MADIKISELTQVSALNNGDLVEVSQVNALAPSGYTSLKASMTDLGKKVNSDIEYTTDLADFTDKTTLGAIKETAKGKNIADEYDGTQTYDNGDVVIYKNTLYICTTNNTTGAWDATKWTATTVQSLIGDLSQLTTTDKSSLVGAVNSLVGWVDATSEFTKASNFDTTQSSYFLYNIALKMYAVSFAVKANTPDNGIVLSSVPKLKNDIIVLPTGFANAGGLSVTQANVIYYKANDNIILRISTTTSVPVFVTAFLLKA